MKELAFELTFFHGRAAAESQYATRKQYAIVT